MKGIIVLLYTCFVMTAGYIPLDQEPEVELDSSIMRSGSFPKIGDIPVLNRKIFKGQRVVIREHPYIVSIRRLVSHYLTGVLLTKNIVASVAHPLLNVPIMQLRAVVGENYSDRGTKLHTVVVIVIHENFDPYTLRNDIALLRLYEDVISKTHVKWIQMAIPNAVLEGTAFVTAWGRCDNMGTELCLSRTSIYYPDEKMDPMLRTVKFPLMMSSNYCESYTQHDVSIELGMLCAGVAREQDKVSPCLGVPGAAMVNKARLVGLLSWGFGCGYNYDLPLVYTDIRYFVPWILHNIRVMDKLKTNNLTELFEAHKAALLSEWLIKTRIVTITLKIRTDKNLELLDADYELVKLQGTVYDIRDFILDGKYHTEKLQMYTTLLANMKDATETPATYFTFTTEPLHAQPHIGNETLESIGFNVSDIIVADTDDEGIPFYTAREHDVYHMDN